ncbi:MAG: hypothetical protein HFJ27_06175 [Clostridia bacterium]|nr:hypothetical protein [Clostridia bacterium]
MIEYAKDEIFTIRYNLKKDELEYPIQKRIKEKIKRHKVLSLFFTMAVIFCMADGILIYYFFLLLAKI